MTTSTPLTLHANWQGTSLLLWAMQGNGASANAETLRAAVGDVVEDSLIATAAPAVTLSLWLPHEETLATRTVAALSLSAAAAIDLLSSLGCPETPTCGPSLRYWATATHFVLARLSAGQFYPDVDQPRADAFIGLWRPLLGGHSIDSLQHLATAMPPSCLAVVGAEGADASALLESFVTATVDAFVRRAVSNDEFFSRVHDLARQEDSQGEVRWLSALLGSDRFFAPHHGNPQVADLARSWISRLDEARGKQSWRIGFELCEPPIDEVDEDDGDTAPLATLIEADAAPMLTELSAIIDSPAEPAAAQNVVEGADAIWTLKFFLESTGENTARQDAADLWADPADAAGVLGRSLGERRALLMSELQRSVDLCPPVSRAMDSATPSAVTLSTAEAHQFLRQWAGKLLDNAFGVIVPDWAKDRSQRLGMLLDVRPELDADGDELPPELAAAAAANGASQVSSGKFGLDSLLDFDWQIAVGDLRLSPAEFQQLASSETPLVRYRGRWMEIDHDAAKKMVEFLGKKNAGKMTLADAFKTAFGINRTSEGVPILGISGSSWVQSFLQQTPATIESLKQPKEFGGTLRHYQLRGLDWLSFLQRMGIGACLADDMGLGKAQPLDAKILTPHGWRTMGEMNVGDRIIGADGAATRVTGVYPQGGREVFRVTFSDGSSTHCCDEHLWYVNSPVRRYRGQPGRVLPLKSIRERLRDSSGNALHFVPLVQPVEFEPARADATLPLAPYLLGALLGDGGIAHRVILSSADDELLAHVATLLPAGVSLKHTGSGVDYRISGDSPNCDNAATNALRRLELLGKKSHEKCIPTIYKFAPPAERLEMLRGLLDTDGHVRPIDNNVEYCTTSPQLAADVQFLVQSFGGTARIREKKTPRRLCYRMSIALPPDVLPFRLSRKAAVYRPRGKYPPSRAIVDVESIGQKPVQCIAVEAADHLYVTDDFLVTHNTIQFISLLLHEREKEPGRKFGPTLLFAPTSVVGNWVKEVDRFAKPLKMLIHHGPDRSSGEDFVAKAMENDLVITSYALAHRDLEDLKKPNWHRIALDEAQKIKNPSAAAAVAIRSLVAPHRVALTGTPIENHLSELWSIMEMLNPGLLGTASEFRERFAVPIEKLADRDRAQQLREMIKPFVLRRTKTDPQVAADLPEKMEMKVFCNLSSEQAAIYERITSDMLGQIDTAKGIRRRGLILAALTRLKQVCNHPILATKDPDAPRTTKRGGAANVPVAQLFGRSGKCERLMEMLEEVIEEGDAAIIFTQYREMGHILETMITEKLRQPVQFLHGGTPAMQRDAMIERFQAPKSDIRLFLLSLRAGGLGLNLTAANHVFHFDRWWNPAVESQATDRAHRIGQTRKVLVHKFVCVGTLEERIDRLLSDKLALADQIVSSGDEWLTNLSTDELRRYLSLSRDAVAEF